MEITVWAVLWVLLVATLTDLATGVGAWLVFLARIEGPRWEALAGAAAAGMMLCASVFAFHEARVSLGGGWDIAVGAILGALLLVGTGWFLGDHDDLVPGFNGARGRQALLLIFAMTIHSIPEGVAVGVGFATGQLGFGILLALAIAMHNIPEGIAVALPLRARGESMGRCFWIAVLTSLPQPLLAVPAFLFTAHFQALLPGGLAFAGGAMIWLAAATMIPESLKSAGWRGTFVAATGGFLFMTVASYLLVMFLGN